MNARQRAKVSAKRPSTKGTNGVWLALGVLVTVAVGVAIVVSGASRQGPPMPTDVVVSIAGDPLPAFSGNPVGDPAVGSRAPTLAGENFEGSAVTIDNDGRGKVILFLAHWCSHCQREVPAVQTYQQEVGFPTTVDFYSVATSYSPNQPNWPPSAWLDREGWTFPVLVDDEESSAYIQFGQGGFPFYVFVDSAGNVAMRLSGEQDPATLAAQMEQLANR
jgi:cytochrome c biogenesis protein CcmG, thiol:disulfide interchange protein DsbE